MADAIRSVVWPEKSVICDFRSSLSAGKLRRIQNWTEFEGTFLFETMSGFYTLAIFVVTLRLKKGSGTNSQMARWVLRTIGS